MKPTKFAVTVVSPPGYAHSAAFHEVAETLHYALLSMGQDSVMTTEGRLDGRRHIVLGSNLLPHLPLPLAPDAILYNLEQVHAGSPWITPSLLTLLRRHVVWDYSVANARAFATLGVHVGHVVPIGYVPELTRIRFAEARDIDVLFCGSLCERRARVIDRMRAAGINAVAAFGLYGRPRDRLIARAKLMLNVHSRADSVLEIVRLSYLLANRCAVLSERCADALDEASLAQAIAFADYDSLSERAAQLLSSAAERERFARKGFSQMCSRRAADYLREALA
ncbi:hypothetical protein [Caballeronia sp. GAFFF1]|uniref:hypothetical protein n=1 Tax=Caballeronia sp. GAFFF1 TaxID=2921779 RepID=UPI002027AFAD|nr:hypothetical protein [Caballeronia sp. GAFFF1]